MAEHVRSCVSDFRFKDCHKSMFIVLLHDPQMLADSFESQYVGSLVHNLFFLK